MSIIENKNAFVDLSSAVALSQMFTITGGSGNPTYLVLCMLDRNEYTKAASSATGTLSGNGRTVALSNLGGDARGVGIVFIWQPSSGRYYNSTLGYFDHLMYTASGSAGDVTNLSLFGTNSYTLATQDAASVYAMMQADAAGYLGSATVVTQSTFSGAVPAPATPNAIASIAMSFVGQACNVNGCWVLASTIAAEAGASLPVQSTAIGLPGQANGEWIVAFNGPAGQSGNWQAMVKAGEMIVIGTPGGGGHVTTVVSGSGPTAMLVDNACFLGGNGQVQNAANDGSANDIIIAAPHAASREWAGVQASSVVIYEVDTPVVTTAVSSASIGYHTTEPLGPWFSATDPAGKAITQWQVYNTATSDAIEINGITYNYHSAAMALTTSSLSTVSLLADSTTITDVVEVRAYNGNWWGDWQALSVSIVPSVAPPPPTLTRQTPDQNWVAGSKVSLVLPANTFADPQGQGLSYAATLANGNPLPAWLSFNGSTETFSGTPTGPSLSLGIQVTATDTSGLSASETFSVAVQSAPPMTIAVTNPTPNQIWADGQSVNLVLPANTFTDTLGLKMTFAAYQTSGPDVTTWLRFNPVSDTFSGTVPANASGTIGLAVIARDAANLRAADIFNVTFAAGAGRGMAAIAPSAMSLDPMSGLPSPFGMLAMHS
jgi:hypothetical protein